MNVTLKKYNDYNLYSQVNKLEEIISDQQRKQAESTISHFKQLEKVDDSTLKKLRRDLEIREEQDFHNIFDRESISKSHLYSDIKAKTTVEKDNSNDIIYNFHSKHSEATQHAHKETQTLKLNLDPQNLGESPLLKPISSSMKPVRDSYENPFEMIKRSNQS